MVFDIIRGDRQLFNHWSSFLNRFLILIIILCLSFSDVVLAAGQDTQQKRPPARTERSYPTKTSQQKPKPVKAQTTLTKEEVKKEEKGQTKIALFPDEYTVLDDFSNLDPEDNEVILKTLEHSRQKYLQALILLDKGDTTSATHYFEKSIEILNRITSYPGIENNKHFVDLARSVIDDYENIVSTIANLDDNSPFFVVRDKLFQQVELFADIPEPELKRIIFPKDSGSSLIGEKTVVEEPKELVISILENDEILKNIAFLTAEGAKGGRRFYKKWLERTTKWFPMMRRIAAEEDVPEELIYLSMIESGLKPTAVSKSSAVGLWQFMRATGEDYGLNDTASVWVDERRDPEKSTRAAFKYLKDLYNMFGDWHLALAAYNCGQGRVGRTILKYGDSTSNYWDIRDKLPRETQHYVPIYVAATKIALNPSAYGFDLDSLNYEQEYIYDTYELSQPLSLSIIAKCIDTTREAIQDLNPELIRSLTPPDAVNYTIKLPKGCLEKFVGNYSTLKAEDKVPWVEHEVKRGQTIAKLAREYNISRQEIAEANGLPSVRARLKNGSIIRIPVDKILYAEKQKAEDEAITSADTKPIPQLRNDKQNAIYHVVRSGESFYSIAGKYGINMTKLRNLNNIPFDDDNLKIGQRLLISENKDTENIAEKSDSDNKLIRHKVKSGESLHSISENYNIPADEIKKTNNLKSDKILIGQMLVIEVPSGNNSLTASASEKTTTHVVKNGESLGLIAGKYGVRENDLKKWNPDKIDGETIFAGSTLIVHEPKATKGSSQATDSNVNKAPKYYTVQSGDTMSSIAKKFGILLNDLKKRNKDVDADKLLVGQKIRIQ